MRRILPGAYRERLARLSGGTGRRHASYLHVDGHVPVELHAACIGPRLTFLCEDIDSPVHSADVESERHASPARVRATNFNDLGAASLQVVLQNQAIPIDPITLERISNSPVDRRQFFLAGSRFTPGLTPFKVLAQSWKKIMAQPPDGKNFPPGNLGFLKSPFFFGAPEKPRLNFWGGGGGKKTQ